MRDKNNSFYLAGDIGGTKTNLGIFKMGRSRPNLQKMEIFSSKNAPNLEAIIKQFLTSNPVTISSACFGIAGPIQSGRCKTTNLPWVVDEKKLEKTFRWEKVCLINDLAATGMAIPLLKNSKVKSFLVNQKNQEQQYII